VILEIRITARQARTAFAQGDRVFQCAFEVMSQGRAQNNRLDVGNPGNGRKALPDGRAISGTVGSHQIWSISRMLLPHVNVPDVRSMRR
jgi:hypothetical protein